jgi:hypothetical protein
MKKYKYIIFRGTDMFEIICQKYDINVYGTYWTFVGVFKFTKGGVHQTNNCPVVVTFPVVDSIILSMGEHNDKNIS